LRGTQWQQSILTRLIRRMSFFGLLQWVDFGLFTGREGRNVGHTFISYAREDREAVSALARALHEAGIEVWLDDRLTIGSQFDAEIEEALAEASNVIVAWSPAAVGSRWVRAEAGDGLERGILVPVLVENVRIPLEFRRVQTLDLTDWSHAGESDKLQRLVDTLRLSRGSEHRAKKWAPDAPKSPATSPTIAQENERQSADIVFRNKYSSRFRLRLWNGNDSFDILYANWIFAEFVKVDGKPVSRKSFSTRGVHRFELPALPDPMNVELAIREDGSMMLSGFTLRVNGRQILDGNVGWQHGWVLGITMCISILIVVDFIFRHVM